MTPSPWPRPKHQAALANHSFFSPETTPARPARHDDVWIPVRGDEVGHAPGRGWLTVGDAGDTPRVCIGRFPDEDRLVWTGEAEAVGSYTLWSQLAADPAHVHNAGVIVRAVQIVQWRAAHRFCGACSVPLVDCDGHLSRKCPRCEELYMVRLSPVAVVMITSGSQVLLVRHAHQAPKMWALVSGYLESGESAEDAVRREVLEEVGVRLASVSYAGSGPSGFGDPHAMLIAFHAEAKDPTLRPGSSEIADACWFGAADIAALPEESLPPAGSLARELIGQFAAEGETADEGGRQPAAVRAGD